MSKDLLAQRARLASVGARWRICNWKSGCLKSHLCRSRGKVGKSCISARAVGLRGEDGFGITAPRGSRVQPWGVSIPLLTHPWGLQQVLGRMGSGRIAARRVGTVWAGASLVFHTPPLHGQGVPDFIRAGGGKRKQVMLQNTTARQIFPG